MEEGVVKVFPMVDENPCRLQPKRRVIKRHGFGVVEFDNDRDWGMLWIYEYFMESRVTIKREFN